jgi:hypothetical protein
MASEYQVDLNGPQYTPDNPLTLYLSSEECEEIKDVTYTLQKVSG